MKKQVQVDGCIIERKTGRELSGVQVDVLDNEHALTDPIGSTVTGEDGRFHMEFDDAWFKELFNNRKPDLHLRFSTEKDVVLGSTEHEVLDLEQPKDKVIKVDLIKKNRNYVMDGKVVCEKGFDFSQIELTIMACVDGRPIARAPVTPEGDYSLNFKYVDKPPMVELRVLPSAFIRKARPLPAVSRKIMPGAFMMKEDKKTFYSRFDLLFPRLLLERLIPLFLKAYHIHGAVYSFGATTVEPIGGLKLDFYEVDRLTLHPLNFHRHELLGSAFTDPYGVYVFDFNFAYLLYQSWIWPDTRPDIRVKIHQYRDGVWDEIFTSPVNWNIEQDWHRDFFIPRNKLVPVPTDEARPVSGFRFTSLGLLPLDSTRLVKGYATTLPGDPIALEHQPFALNLRLFGLFGVADKVKTYKVQIARADEDHPISAWTDLTDPLYNRFWNAGTRKWDVRFLGPDPNTGRYICIDDDPVYKWHEHSLKITWNSRNVNDGFYAMRMLGYDKDGHIVDRAMPYIIMRIDNSLPRAELRAINVGRCGNVQLNAERDLELEFTAYDSARHIWSYNIAGSRGQHAVPAGSIMGEYKPNSGQGWVNRRIDFRVDPLPPVLNLCDVMAYNFELHVQGSATNGYSPKLQAQRIEKEINLIVSEP